MVDITPLQLTVLMGVTIALTAMIAYEFGKSSNSTVRQLRNVRDEMQEVKDLMAEVKRISAPDTTSVVSPTPETHPKT